MLQWIQDVAPTALMTDGRRLRGEQLGKRSGRWALSQCPCQKLRKDLLSCET